MKINGNNLKPGMIISHKGSNWKVVSAQSVKPGKGGAFAQAELKNLKDNSKLNERFRANEDVERLYVESKEFQFSYKDDINFYFMDTTNYEQINLSSDIVGDLEIFLQDNMIVTIEFVDDKAVSLKLPEHVKEKVVDTEAVIKGQTAASSFKPAILSNGFKVMVPGHIENETYIIISTSSFTYVEKAKN